MLTCFKSHSAFTGKRTDFSIQRLLREEYLDSISEEGRKKSNCIGCTVTTFLLHWYCAGTLNCFTIFITAIGADGVLQKKVVMASHRCTMCWKYNCKPHNCALLAKLQFSILLLVLTLTVNSTFFRDELHTEKSRCLTHNRALFRRKIPALQNC